MRNKFRELSISMLIGLVSLLIIISLSAKAMSAYFSSHTTLGEVIEYSVKRVRPAYYSVGQFTPERHEILVEYSVNNQLYWVLVNSHVYSAIGLVEKGDKVLLSYSQEHPEHGYVLHYALFSTLVSILAPFVLLIFLAVTPQWLYQYRQRKHQS
jgi:hypothetical protein